MSEPLGGDVDSQQWIDRIEQLVHQAESLEDPKARRVAVDLVEAVLKFHAAALERVMDIVASSGPAGEEIFDRIAGNDLASSVLLLHGLHPDDLETRVLRAVEKLHHISLLALKADTVTLRVEKPTGRSATPRKAAIEAAIYQAAPEITTVVIEGLEEPPIPNFFPLSKLTA